MNRPPLFVQPPPMKTVDKIQQNKINHVTLILDASSSMRGRETEVIKATDGLVKFLADRSKDMDQETRITVYQFASFGSTQCFIYDKDVLRMPSLKGLYSPYGNTALMEATMQAIQEAKDIPQRYGDHAFLFYVFTDGEENDSRFPAAYLNGVIAQAPENYTLACLVPDSKGVSLATQCGFPNENVRQWDTTGSVEDVGAAIQASTQSFFTARAAGIRGTKSLFTMDLSKLTTSKVENNLIPLRSNAFSLQPIKRKSPIAQFVAHYFGRYVKGRAFYELSKPELIQGGKYLAVQDKRSGKVYTGTEVRNLLGLPNYDVKVEPDSHPDYKIFVQSTSVNRNLMPGTEVLVLQ